MSKYQATPGPWKLEPCPENKDAFTLYGSEGLGRIADIYEWQQFPGYGTANANLIFAALDMLEALELLVDDFTEQGDFEDYERLQSVIKTRAAIKKAKG